MNHYDQKIEKRIQLWILQEKIKQEKQLVVKNTLPFSFKSILENHSVNS